MKKAVIVAGAVLAALLLGALLLPYVINVDKFRPAVESQMRSALGRQVSIGKLELSFMAGGAAATNVSIADDEAFSRGPFLQAKSIRLGVDVYPMIFARALRISSLTLEQPELLLLRTPAGTWNFSSLGTRAKTAAPRPGAAVPAGTESDISIRELKIEDGRITVGRAPGPAGRNARASAAGKQYTYDHVNLTARNVSYSSEIPFQFEALSPGGGKIKLEGTAGPIDRKDAAQTPVRASITVEHLDLAATGFLDPSSGIAGVLDYTGTLKSDGKTLHSAGKATTDKLRVAKAGGPARQPVSFEHALDYDFKKQSGAITRGDIRLGQSTAKLGGTMETRGDATIVHLKLNGDRLPVQDVEGLLPAFGVVLPAGASLQGGVADAHLALEGPIDHLVTSGPVNVSNARLTGFDLASKLSGMAALAGVKHSSETLIETMSSRLRMAPEGLHADDLNLVIPSLGTITGQGTIAANNALNFKMQAKLSSSSLLGGMRTLTSFGQAKNTLPFLVQGTTSNPIFVPDVANAVAGTVTAPAQGLGGVFGGIFGKKK